MAMGCVTSKDVEDMRHNEKAIRPVMKSSVTAVNSLKKYKMKNVLHKGNHSCILQVENKATKSLYAIRVFPLKQCQYWKNEIFILRRVKHDNIVKLFEIFNQREKKFLVLELAAGGSLADRILAQAYFSEFEIAKIIRKILGAVYYLQLLEITHRDINPENILLSHVGADAKVMLSNFRSAHCNKTPSEVMHGAYGKCEYRAPEMIVAGYTKAVDMWSVGAIMHELYTGSVAFSSSNLSLWDNHSKYTLPFLSGLLNVDAGSRLSAHQALTDKYMKIVSIKPRKDETPPESLCSFKTDTISKSTASWPVCVYPH